MGAPKIMTSTPLTRSDPGPEPRVSVQQIEAARYAVLRRLAPSLRHHMVRPLQPIGLIYGVLNHKLSADAPDLQAVRLEAFTGGGDMFERRQREAGDGVVIPVFG